MNGNFQWALAQLFLTLLLVLVWPITIVGVGKSITMIVIYVVGSIVFWLAVDEEKVTLPEIFKLKD